MAQTPTTNGSLSVEQARRVRWLRNIPRYHRPLGELIDEGYLTDERLRWAAAHAYDNELRQAATVLLAARAEVRAPSPGDDAKPKVADAPAVKLPMSVDEARTTSWPFGPLKGRPMGELIDGNRIGLRDLGYAVENAWDQRVRDAAIVSLTIRLNQVAEEPRERGILRVVSGGKSYSEHLELDWTMLQGGFFGALGVIWLATVIWVVRRIVTDPRSMIPRLTSEQLPGSMSPIVALAILAGALALTYWLLNRLMTLPDRMDEQIERARKGREGEESLEETLRQGLDGSWTLFRNVVLPGRNPADIDGVLVGPTGVWALEAKNLSGEYRNFGEHWEYRAGKRWKLCKKSPSRQARLNAIRLSEFLKADGVKQFVNPVVVWLNPDVAPIVEHPQVPVWTWDRLPEELGNLWQGHALDAAQSSTIVEKLTDLARRSAQEDRKRP